MSDALSLLRNFVKNKKDFSEEDDKIIFGDLYYLKNVKTTYLIYGTGKDDRAKDYYTLECLAFLIKNRDLQHAMYVKNAGTRNISVVLRPDRRELLRYLDGEIETTSSIDKYAPIEIAMQRPQPYSKSSSSNNVAGSGGVTAHKRPVMITEDDQEPMDTSSSKLAKMNDYQQMELGDQQSINNNNTNGTSQNASQIQSAAAAASQTAALKDAFIGRITKRFDETAAQSSRPITENIMPLSEQLSIEKIVSIKAKKKAQQRTKVSSGVEMDDDLLIQSGVSGSGTGTSSSMSKKLNDDHNRSVSGSSHSKYDYLSTGSSSTGFISGIGMMGTDDSDTIMREIIQRERVCRSRSSVLQSAGKQFDKDISAFLQSIKAKEEGGGVGVDTSIASGIANGSIASQQNTSAVAQGASQKSRPLGYNRFDQERYGAKDETGGFSIDTKLTYQPNAGSMSLTPNPNAPASQPLPTQTQNRTSSTSSNYFQSTQLTQQKANILASGVPNAGISNSSQNNSLKSKSGTALSSSSQLQKRSHSNPIIIIPAARTSLIQMINSLDILQELKFVSVEEKKKSLQNQNIFKEAEIIMHRKEDGQTVQFKVIDNVSKLAPHDWERVVAVFAQGAQWQFKDWPLGDGNPTEIFNKVKGFHLKLSGIPLDTNIAKWSVNVIELDPHKRHLDRARLLNFWDELDKYMLKSKPHLCV